MEALSVAVSVPDLADGVPVDCGGMADGLAGCYGLVPAVGIAAVVVLGGAALAGYTALALFFPHALNKLVGAPGPDSELPAQDTSTSSGTDQSGGPSRQELLEELSRQGIKHNPEDIVLIGTDGTGRIIFLENGNSRAGLRHIIERHAADFVNAGVAEEKITELVFSAVTDGKVVGMQRTRPIYEVTFDGTTQRVAVSVGGNGFIVGANPVGH